MQINKKRLKTIFIVLFVLFIVGCFTKTGDQGSNTAGTSTSSTFSGSGAVDGSSSSSSNPVDGSNSTSPTISSGGSGSSGSALTKGRPQNPPTSIAEKYLKELGSVVRLVSPATDIYTARDDRSKYQKGWALVYDNCSIRAVLLERSSLVTVTKNNHCTIKYGEWKDPYSGRILKGNPYRGDGTENDLDIDHIIPVGYVHNHGGASWSASKKHEYGNSVKSMNDGLYIAVSSQENRTKSDKGPSVWMPSNTNYGCTYVEDWVKISKLWKISLDPSDFDFIKAKLKKC